MVISGDLFFDLSVGDFGGALVEQPGARHNDSVLVVDFHERADLGRSFFEDSRHFGVVVSDGSGCVEHELELAFGGVRIVIEYFSEGCFARLLYSQFNCFDAVERIFN